MKSITMGKLKFQVNKGLVTTIALRDSVLDDIGDPEEVVKELSRIKVKADLLTFTQTLTDLKPKFDLPFVWESVAAVPITTYEQWFMKEIHPNARNKIRKAKRLGVVVKIEELDRTLAEGLAGIFNESKIRRGRPYEYYGADVETVLRQWSPNLHRSNFLVAYYKGEVIGFIQLVYGNKVARTAGTVAKMSHRDKSPMNALLAKAVELCCEKKVSFLVYGKYVYGKRGVDSLTLFKKNNGFREIKVPRYYVPLSLRGKIAFKLGLHRSLSEIMPRYLYEQFAEFRKIFYEKIK